MAFGWKLTVTIFFYFPHNAVNKNEYNTMQNIDRAVNLIKDAQRNLLTLAKKYVMIREGNLFTNPYMYHFFSLFLL